jgi:hypothetical protein
MQIVIAHSIQAEFPTEQEVSDMYGLIKQTSRY